jgi:creatinine amidohydrolase
MKRLCLLLCLLIPLHANAAESPPSLFLEELTWPEVKEAIENGYTRILIPTAGTEQNGRHVILAKHRYVVTHNAQQIAQKTGHTLIAPPIVYVPEAPHMAYPGTISLSEKTFYNMLHDTALSLADGGFTQIYFLGDSGGNQAMQDLVAKDLGKALAKRNIRLANLSDYYAGNGQIDWLKTQGFTEEQIGTHAGIRDTSELLALYPQGVRVKQLANNAQGDSSGAHGDATKATAEIGKKMLELKQQATIRQIQNIESQPLLKTSWWD